MQTEILKTEIYKEISLLREDKLSEVKDFIEFILSRQKPSKKKVMQLKGIWAGKGFEEIEGLEKELKSIQKKTMQSILKKDI